MKERNIIEELTQKGIYKNGKPFAVNTVYGILKNEKKETTKKSDD